MYYGIVFLLLTTLLLPYATLTRSSRYKKSLSRLDIGTLHKNIKSSIYIQFFSIICILIPPPLFWFQKMYLSINLYEKIVSYLVITWFVASVANFLFFRGMYVRTKAEIESRNPK